MRDKVSPEYAKNLANLIINDVSGWLNADESNTLGDGPLTPERIADLIDLVTSGKISKSQQKTVFATILEEDKDPQTIVEEKGLEQVSDTGAIEAVVDKVLADNPDKVEQYKGGKTGLIGFFVGQCMKAMQGKGDPKVINQLLAEKLK